MSEVKEMKSLTLNGKKYDSFLDQAAREAVGKKLPAPDSAKVGQYLKVTEVDVNGKVTEVGAGNAPAGDSPQNATVVYHIATDYDISTDAEDNTPALQLLVDSVSESGGGIIFFPVGTYNFKKAESDHAILMKSNVSIVGENMETTILKQTEASPYSLFYRKGGTGNVLSGCSFSNFTVDAYGTGNNNAVYGKAFFMTWIKDCVFRDLRLMGTVATALGIDHIHRVVIDGVHCIDCGRTYSEGREGTSGIGIGTGYGGEDGSENFIITNCTCTRCGQFGIFIEHQSVFNGEYSAYTKGVVIANCIVRNGLNRGIGVRGGGNVTVIGCESYENASDGFYIDGCCKNVKITDCNSANNIGHGFNLANAAASSNVTLQGNTAILNSAGGISVNPSSTLEDAILRENTILNNRGNSIEVLAAVTGLSLIGNYTKGGTVGLSLAAATFPDSVIKNNVFVDGTISEATFTGNTSFNDLHNTVLPTEIKANDMSISEGDVTRIVVTIIPSDANPGVTYKSSDTTVATVSTTGLVTAVSAGDCQITIASIADASVTKAINVHVEAVGDTEVTRTIANAEFTSGKALDSSYNEVDLNGAGLSGYIDITDLSAGGAIIYKIDNLVFNGGVSIVQYNQNKIALTNDTVGSASGTQTFDDYSGFFALDENCKYVRVSLGILGSNNVVLTAAVCEEYSDSNGLAVGTKLNPNGSTAAESGWATSDYVSCGSWGNRLLASYTRPGAQGNGIRVAFYDSSHTSLSSNWPMSNDVNRPMMAELADTACYMRVARSAYSSGTKIYVAHPYLV